MEKDIITDDTMVSTSELACVLGLTGRRIRQMAEDGQLQKSGTGRFALCAAVRQYLQMVSVCSADPDDKRLDKMRRQSEVTMKASKAQIAKLEMQELQGKMHRSEDVAAMTEDLIYTVRGTLMALPGRLAVDVAATASAAEAAEVIRKEVHKAMRELSNYRYDPAKYEERVRERRNWDTSSVYDDEDS